VPPPQYHVGIIAQHKLLVFVTPVMSFHIRNQDPLLTDNNLLQGTFANV